MKSLGILLVAFVLAGCAGNSRHPLQSGVYDFGLPVEPLVADGRWLMVALEMRAPHWFDSRDIDYRLVYDNPLKLRSYAESRWVGAPGLLLSQRLRQQLGFVGVAGRAAVGCLLRLELQEFTQVFESPQNSRGMVQGRASLLDARHRIIAERPLVSEQPAPTADARGGVIALVAASEDLGRQLADWLNDLEKRGRLEDCRSPAGENR